MGTGPVRSFSFLGWAGVASEAGVGAGAPGGGGGAKIAGSTGAGLTTGPKGSSSSSSGGADVPVVHAEEGEVEGLAELIEGTRPFRRVAAQRLLEDRAEYHGVEQALMDLGREGDGRCRGIRRRDLRAKQLAGREGEGVQVGAPVRLQSRCGRLQALRGGELHGSLCQAQPGPGQRSNLERGGSETEDLHALPVTAPDSEEVVGGEVAVGDPSLRELLEALHGFQNQADDARGRGAGRRIEAGTRDELHHHEGAAVGCEPVVEQHRETGWVQRGERVHRGQEARLTHLQLGLEPPGV